MRTYQYTKSDPEQDQQNEGECEYLEPVPRHEYEELDDSAIQTDNLGEEEEGEDHYELVGSMEELELREDKTMWVMYLYVYIIINIKILGI